MKRKVWIPESDSIPFPELRRIRRAETQKANDAIAGIRAKQQIEFRVPVNNYLLGLTKDQKK